MPISVVDIIPFANSLESDQNAEPSIAVNPFDPTQIIAASFGGGSPPYFVSTNSGADWSIYQYLKHKDTSLAWSQDGTAATAPVLTAILGDAPSSSDEDDEGDDPDAGNLISTYSGTVAGGTFGSPINTFTGSELDQPWIRTGPSNHVYIAYFDPASAAGQSA